MTEISGAHRLKREREAKMRDKSNGALLYPNELGNLTRINTINRKFVSHDRDTLSQETHTYVVAGRLMARRGNFMVIQESPLAEDRIQLYCNAKSACFKSAPEILRRIELWDIGDIVSAGGLLTRSAKGDLYLNIDSDCVEPKLVAKSLQPPPEKYHGLKDTEIRSRKRYLDLTHNVDSWNTFVKRGQIMTALRNFLNENGYTEVETPMLHPLPGGALAKPFVTHHQALNQEMYMRISPELYLKRLIVGGMRQIYEIGNSFRNEGVSPRHNPEFVMLELYKAYATHRDMIELLCSLFKALTPAPHILSYKQEQIDFSKIKEVEFLSGLVDAHPDLAMDVAAMEKSLQDAKSNTELVRYLSKQDIETHASWSNAKLLLELFEKTVEPALIQPTLVVNYPAAISPLARPFDDSPWLAQRFEFIVAGIEIANGCSELNDPVAQERNFRAQTSLREDGDEEAMYFDRDYIETLEHGMPPAAGLGIGVDRLVMLLCDMPSLRDVQLFPHMRTL